MGVYGHLGKQCMTVPFIEILPPVRDRSVYRTHHRISGAVGYLGNCHTNHLMGYHMRADGHMSYHRMPTVHAIQMNSCCLLGCSKSHLQNSSAGARLATRRNLVFCIITSYPFS